MGALLLCVIAVAAGISSGTAPESQFTLTISRLCLKSQFVSYFVPTEISVEACATHCNNKQGSKCMGFQLSDDGSRRCRMFEFDRCSHNLNWENCTNFEWIYVRKLSGLLDGRLCPKDYGHYRLGSSYKLVNARYWFEGKWRCGTDLGLSKFADASDRLETEYMHWLRANSFSEQKSFFIGGHKRPNGWRWAHCDEPILPEVWGPGQPNEKAGLCTDIWWEHRSGVDDMASSYYTPYYDVNIKYALCECIDPFA